MNSVSVLSGLSASEVLGRRYGDAYKVARGIVAYSKVIKVIAMIIGGSLLSGRSGNSAKTTPELRLPRLLLVSAWQLPASSRVF